MRAITEYVFENSALKHLVERPGGLQPVLDAATAKKSALLIPGMTVGEFLNNRNPRKTLERLQALICLSQHDGYSGFSADPRKMLELDAKGDLEGTPLLTKESISRSSLEKSIANPEDPQGYLSKVRGTMSAWKRGNTFSPEKRESAVDHWLSAQFPGPKPWSLSQKREFLWHTLANISPETLSPTAFQGFLREFKLPDKELSACLEQNGRFKAIKTLVGLDHLRVIGLLLSAGGKDPEGFEELTKSHGYLKPDKNDFTDATVAMSAAYAHYLVTEDEALCERCLFLGSKACVSFRAILLEEFYELLGLDKKDPAR